MGDHIGVRHCTTRFFWSCQVYTSVSTRRNGTHLLPIWNPFVSSIPPIPNPFCGKERTGQLCDGWRCGDTSDRIKITNHLLETDVIIANRNAERGKFSINKMLLWRKWLCFLYSGLLNKREELKTESWKGSLNSLYTAYGLTHKRKTEIQRGNVTCHIFNGITKCVLPSKNIPQRKQLISSTLETLKLTVGQFFQLLYII